MLSLSKHGLVDDMGSLPGSPFDRLTLRQAQDDK